MVLDILAPKTDAAAYAPPGMLKPQVTAMKNGLSPKQAQAITDTANQLAGKSAPPVAQPAKPDVKAETKTADAKPANAKTADTKTAESKPAPAPVAQTPANVQTADGHLVKNGAVITFKGAGAHANAIFVRGLTAWIVLDNTPDIDATRLKSQLGDFAAQMEASSASGISVLRIGLKQPAQIACGERGRGSEGDDRDQCCEQGRRHRLRPQSGRSQACVAHHALAGLGSSSQPDRSGHRRRTPDVVPGNSGHAVAAERDYAEFAALPTASGLVITPYADDLSVTVAHERITVTRPGGLSLTPLLMPVEETPAAMAAERNGPSFLDFAAWGPLTGGSFLATERRLRGDVARLAAPRVNRAQLVLARFYLANRFAAEALGLINLIQASDPGLRGDIQLATMRAAADYMMGRYRDAHNDLAGPSFDADRHAALWRGLTEAALENWRPSPHLSGTSRAGAEEIPARMAGPRPPGQRRGRAGHGPAGAGGRRLDAGAA